MLLRARQACGILAPASFVGAWIAGGLRSPSYDPLKDAISQLARVGAPTRPLMTSGFLAFSALAPWWAGTAARATGQPHLRTTVLGASIATVGVAALPLGASFGDGPHATAAGLAYVCMGLSPVLGGVGLARQGHPAAARASYAVGALAGVALVASLLGKYDGGFQRLGLTSVDAWFVVLAVQQLRNRTDGQVAL